MEQKFTFDLGSVFGALQAALNLFTSMFRPVGDFMREVAGQSWLGFALVFALGFTLLLVRTGARSASGIAVYGGSLEYIGKRGALACLAALALLGLQWALMPPLAVLTAAIGNSASGSEPGLGELVAFLGAPSPARAAFLTDVLTFYSEGHVAFPLGFKALTLVAVAFGCMLLVGKAAGAITGRPPAA